MQDVSVARLQSTRVQTALSPSFKCNVLRESLTVDSQHIPCATLKKRGSWITFVYLCSHLFSGRRRGIFSFPMMNTTCHHAGSRGGNKTAVVLAGRGRGGCGEEPDEPGEGGGEEEDPGAGGGQEEGGGGGGGGRALPLQVFQQDHQDHR
jgi:hypothetical protein